MKKSSKNSKTEKTVIYVKSYRHWKTGRIIKASDYGLKAFRLEVNQKD